MTRLINWKKDPTQNTEEFRSDQFIHSLHISDRTAQGLIADFVQTLLTVHTTSGPVVDEQCSAFIISNTQAAAIASSGQPSMVFISPHANASVDGATLQVGTDSTPLPLYKSLDVVAGGDDDESLYAGGVYLVITSENADGDKIWVVSGYNPLYELGVTTAATVEAEAVLLRARDTDADLLTSGVLTRPWQPGGSKTLSILTISGVPLTSTLLGGQLHLEY